MELLYATAATEMEISTVVVMLYSSGDVLLEQGNMSHCGDVTHSAYRMRRTWWVCCCVGRAHVCSSYAVSCANTHTHIPHARMHSHTTRTHALTHTHTPYLTQYLVPEFGCSEILLR